MSRSRIRASRDPHLDKWYLELLRIPGKEALILPYGADQRLHALIGDKLLGAAAARAIARTRDDIQDPGSATILLHTALSNRSFAKNIRILLPDTVYPFFRQDLSTYSDHKLGSMLEAAVFHVSKSTHNHSNAAAASQVAIDQLAEWLISQVEMENPFRLMPASQIISSPKKRLLVIGGSVSSRRVGGLNHQPEFEATAVYRGRKTVCRAFSKKKDVERRAAMDLLEYVQFIDGY